MIGQTISHYQIKEKLGEGGMGIVYKAEDTKLEREVAIKFLPKHISANSEERERFKIEAKAAASLNHPNIATIHAIEESNDDIFIVMEYIDGEELKDRIKTGTIPTDEAINIAVQIAEGLQAAHKKGIVHRDIKAANIMITNDGKVKIMDFGLAKIGKGTQVTKIGSTVGTIAYMSPEQARGEEINHQTDIWSFGILLYEMLTGKQPFKGDYDQAVIYSILNEEPQSISLLQNDVPAILQYVINKCLAKSCGERFQSAGDLLSVLKEKKSGDPVSQKNTVKKSSSNKKWKIIVFAVSVLILIFIAAMFFSKFPESASINLEKSIAVLPFTNLSTDPEQEYFADGMAEEIINALSKVPLLKVSARTSSFRFRGQETDIKTIGEKLGVGTILEGSVRKSGNKIRITAQLINVSDGFNLWSNTYERELTDVFEIQDDLSKSIVEALQVKLSGDQIYNLNKKKSTNIEAYNLYLKGRYYWNKRSEEDVNKSMEYFQQAIDIDSTYAQAYAGLGDSYLIIGVYGRRKPYESISIAKSFIEKALRLNDKLSEAYATLGDINIHYDWNLDAAESNLKKAIELNPQYASAYHWYSEVLVLRGEFENAYKQSQNALEIDPYSLIINTQLGEHYQRGKEYQKAIDQLQKTLEFDSTFAYAYYDLGIIYIALNQFNDALNYFRKAYSLAPEDTRILSGLAYSEGLTGSIEKAKRFGKVLLKRAESKYVPSYDLAVVSLGLGQKDEALEYLEKAYEERGPWMLFLKLNPLFNTISADLRFQELFKKIIN